MRQAGRYRFFVTIAVVLLAAILFFLFYQVARALEFWYHFTTLADFNDGFFYHTALSWRDDGEVQLLPVGLPHPWEPTTSLPYARSGHASAVYDTFIYVIGGVGTDPGDSNAPFHHTVYYSSIDPGTHHLAPWQLTTPLPTSVYGELNGGGVAYHDAVALDGYLYVMGGKEDEGGVFTYFDSVVYAPILTDGTLGSWQVTAPLPVRLFGLEAMVLNGRIYVLGGSDEFGQSRREVYFAQPNPDGSISSWTETTLLPVPPPDLGGYYGLAATHEHGRLYVFGGASGTVGPSVSPLIYFADVLTTTGQISGSWSMSVHQLGRNLYAGEGTAYESGMLLAVAGALDEGTSPTGDVRVALIDHDTGETMGDWVATLALDPPRFWHTVVQDQYGWLYAIGGVTGLGASPRLKEVWMASPYEGGGGMGGGEAIPLHRTEETSQTQYAPDGLYTSPYIDLRFEPTEGVYATLTSFSWNATFTDSSVMSLTAVYDCHSPSGWIGWQGPFPALEGENVTTTLDLSGEELQCDYFRYRFYFSAEAIPPAELPTFTPIVNSVRVGVLAPPDLRVQDGTLEVNGCSVSPCVVPVDQAVDIQFRIENRSTALEYNDGFYTMLFAAPTEDYNPYPDLPGGCYAYSPTVDCPLIWAHQGSDFSEGYSTTLSASWTFTLPGTYYLFPYVDYNDTPAHSPPVYDIPEFNEANNRSVQLTLHVGLKQIFMPLVVREAPAWVTRPHRR